MGYFNVYVLPSGTYCQGGMAKSLSEADYFAICAKPASYRRVYTVRVTLKFR